MDILKHPKPIIISIDGNIGSGKSTLFENLKKYYKTYDHIGFVEEPVDEWKTIVDAENTPILTNLYKDTKKFSFRFQMMAYISRLSLLKKTIKENNFSIIFTERSVYTDKEIFAQMLYDDGFIEHDEFLIYKQWFDHFLEDVDVNGLIYVRADPTICSKRVVKRSREGEIIQESYLENVHKYHEKWLNKKNSFELLSLEANVEINKDYQPNDSNDENLKMWLQKIDEFITKIKQKIIFSMCSQKSN